MRSTVRFERDGVGGGGGETRETFEPFVQGIDARIVVSREFKVSSTDIRFRSFVFLSLEFDYTTDAPCAT